MKKTIKRSGFTIVELVIVIAVIAILAGVLIPTFGGIIERANYSNDNQIVANINKVLVVEDIITGREPNDVVEIQKYIKENGLSLKTKSEDNYIWYNIEKNQVFLAKLDLSGTNPALVTSEKTIPVEFNKELTAPEAFISGYLFLSEEADGDLAKCIWTLRNPESKQDLIDSLTKIQGLENGSGLHSLLSTLMNRTAVMTEADTFYMGYDGSAVTRIIVSSEMTTVTENSVKNLKTRFPRVIVVDFHSGVVEMEDGAKAIISGVTDEDKMFFVYISDEIKTKYDTNPNIKYLITKDERGDEIASVELIYIDKTGNEIGGTGTLPLTEFIKSEYKFTSNYPFQPDHKNGTTYYGFSHYSLRKDGTKDFDTDVSKVYILNEDEKLLIDSNKAFYIYAVFEEDHEDFQINDGAKYSSRYMTYMLANNKVANNSVIKVITTTATLGNETYKTLTIPSTVTLLLPYKSDFTQAEWTITAGSGATSYNANNYKPDAVYDKNKITGKTNLTIAGNVKLNISSGASIYVDAAIYNYATSTQCYITDNCGVLVLNEGSEIISSGNITAYGIIRGNGTITTNGGTVTELMTMYDWYGGANAYEAVKNKKVMPFNNWKMESIIVEKMIINYPTKYAGRSGTVVSVVGQVEVNGFVLAGPKENDSKEAPMFVMEEGTIVERSVSNSSKNLNFAIVAGKVKDSEKILGIPATLGYEVEIKFNEIGLPISNMDIVVAPGAELTVSNNIYKIMPGSSIIVQTETDKNGNKVENGKNGILNIGTKVVICNSFALKFEEKSATGWEYGLSRDRNRYTFELIDGGAKIKVLKETQTLGWSGYGNSVFSSPVQVGVPQNTYVGKDSAQFIVNGILNFNANAQFAGDITSTVSGAKINVNANVSGYEIPEGYYIQSDAVGNRWYDVHDPNLYKVPYLGGTKCNDELTKVGYYYKSDVGIVGGNSFCKWGDAIAQP